MELWERSTALASLDGLVADRAGPGRVALVGGEAGIGKTALVDAFAARRLDSRYCALAHAAVLRDRHLDDTALEAVVTDRNGTGLPAAELAVLDFAEKIAADPGAATEADADRLRAHGLSDVDIFQVVLAVAIRRFFAGVLDATGTDPDPVYDSLGPRLLAAL